jgi:small subunit ribosomal protein S6
MKKYEVMYILKAGLDDAARNAEIEKLHAIFTKNGGSVKKVDTWGLRDLAYPINDETKGFYVVIKVEADNVCLKEFERLTKFDRNMLRHLVTIDKD